MTDSPAQHLATYLNDHLMGATAGLELFKRAAASLPEVEPLVAEVEQDRQALLGFLEAVGAAPDQLKVVAGWVGEKLGRLKPNGHLVSRSPLSDVVELEGLVIGVQGKLAGWRLLRSLGDPRLTGLDELVARGEQQLAQLDALRLDRARQVLTASEVAG